MRFNANHVWSLSIPPNSFGVFELAKCVWRVLFTPNEFQSITVDNEAILISGNPKIYITTLKYENFCLHNTYDNNLHMATIIAL